MSFPYSNDSLATGNYIGQYIYKEIYLFSKYYLKYFTKKLSEFFIECSIILYIYRYSNTEIENFFSITFYTKEF